MPAPPRPSRATRRAVAAVFAPALGAVLASVAPGRTARAQSGLIDFAASPTELLGSRCNYPEYPFPSDPQYGSIPGQLKITYLWRAALAPTDPPNSAGCADVRVDTTGFYSGIKGMAHTSTFAGAMRVTPLGGKTFTFDSFLTGYTGLTGGTAPDQVRIWDVATGALLWGQDQARVGGGPTSWAPGLTVAGPVELQWANKGADFIGLAQVRYTLNATPTAVPEPTTMALVALGALGVGGVARRRRSRA